jgi:hypothetical protein
MLNLIPLCLPCQFGEKHLRPVGRAEVVASLRLALSSLGFYRPTASEGDRGGVTIISHSKSVLPCCRAHLPRLIRPVR